MEKSYEPAEIEAKWYARWDASGAFQPSGHGAPYCILLPPPNVTGTLHMGHAFQQTVMDILVRYQRMRGRNTLWQVGTDHAGIATQKIVENQLAAEGKSRQDVGREAFIERVWRWKEESGSTITGQMRRLGATADWSRERFTMDDGLSTAVRKVFIEWYRAGLIYRGNRLVNWDPVLGTAVSDLEVNNVERDGHMWSIRYPTADGTDSLIVATTRPETMLGDVAVAVHPDDARYAHLVGKTLMLPLSEREIPVIADDYVDKDFGTGCVKITPAHDFNDYAIGKRHRLDMISFLSLDGKIRSHADVHHPNGTIAHSSDVGIPVKYHSLDRFEARKRIVCDLEAEGLLVEIRPHKLQVPVSQRSDAVIEPMLTDQWFVDLTIGVQADGRPGGRKAIVEPALDAVRSGEIKFVPENWTTTYSQWLEHIEDWCISRQLWWGHRIPAWYDKHKNYYVAESAYDAHVQWFNAIGNPQVPEKATLLPSDNDHEIDQKLLRFGWNDRLVHDGDVLDTWFSSALWPFSTLGWPGVAPVKNEHGAVVADWQQDKIFLPSAVLVTGFDIIFFWVARMVMTTRYFTGQIPFREVYINAIVRDAEGQKMSKSKGNTLDPLDLIDGIELEPLVAKSIQSLLLPQVREKVERRIRKDYPDGIAAIGTDALRFTFTALASYSRTINFDMKRAEGYKAFCNKLWNAARFVLMNVGEASAGELSTPNVPVTEAERWIFTRLKQTLIEVEQHYVTYRFDHLAQALYEFVWNEYCDWFVELSKPALNGDDTAAADSTRRTLLVVLETVLRALHPIIPFITEEIWQALAPRLGLKEKYLLLRPWPEAADIAEDGAATNEIEWFKSVLSGIRRIRSEMNISPAKTIPLLLADGDDCDRSRIDKFAAQISFLARTEAPQWVIPGATEVAAAAAVIGNLRILLPLAGLIDLDAEKARLAREIARIETEIRKCEGKLDNANFVANAPEAVVVQERQRIVDWNTTLGGLRAQAQKLD